MKKKIKVLSPGGDVLSPCSLERAHQMVNRGKAFWVDHKTVQLIVDRQMFRRFRQEVLERDNYTCYITGRKLSPEEATVDHIRSRCRGGSDFPENLACCSKEHNSAKGDLDLEQYVWILIHSPDTDEDIRQQLIHRFPHLVDLPKMP